MKDEWEPWEPSRSTSHPFEEFRTPHDNNLGISQWRCVFCKRFVSIQDDAYCNKESCLIMHELAGVDRVPKKKGYEDE